MYLMDSRLDRAFSQNLRSYFLSLETSVQSLSSFNADKAFKRRDRGFFSPFASEW